MVRYSGVNFRESDFSEEGEARIKDLYINLVQDINNSEDSDDDKREAIERLDGFVQKYKEAKKIYFKY